MNEAELEEFEERAAILEYEAGMNRDDAERIARDIVLSKRGQMWGLGE